MLFLLLPFPKGGEEEPIGEDYIKWRDVLLSPKNCTLRYAISDKLNR